MQRVLTILGAVGLAVATIGPTGGVPAGAAVPAKKLNACKALTIAEVEAIVGNTVSKPNPSKSFGTSVCDWEVGDGIGSPDGGLVVLQLYKGVLGKNIYSETKKVDEKVGRVYWNAETGIGTGREGNTTIAASLSVTGTRPGDHRDATVALVEAAADNL